LFPLFGVSDELGGLESHDVRAIGQFRFSDHSGILVFSPSPFSLLAVPPEGRAIHPTLISYEEGFKRDVDDLRFATNVVEEDYFFPSDFFSVSSWGLFPTALLRGRAPPNAALSGSTCDGVVVF
jgi:hypothetical protein